MLYLEGSFEDKGQLHNQIIEKELKGKKAKEDKGCKSDDEA